jgi:hypothetical protein
LEIAAPAAGGAAASAGLGGVLTSVLTSPIVVTGLALAIGGNVGLAVGNAIAGTNQTWADIGETAKMILALNGMALDKMIGFFGGHSDVFGAVSDALGISDQNQANAMAALSGKETSAIVNGQANAANSTNATLQSGFGAWLDSIGKWFGGGKASGGYVTNRIYRMHPNEFVMNAHTTRNAERALGGGLTQSNLTRMLSYFGGDGGGTLHRSNNLETPINKDFSEKLLNKDFAERVIGNADAKAWRTRTSVTHNYNMHNGMTIRSAKQMIDDAREASRRALEKALGGG